MRFGNIAHDRGTFITMEHSRLGLSGHLQNLWQGSQLGRTQLRKDDAMSIQTGRVEEEPPSTHAQRVVGKAAHHELRLLCLAPIAILPAGLACRALLHLLS
jgi:hypothetical protein